MLKEGEKTGHQIEAELDIGIGRVYRWRRERQDDWYFVTPP
jgi:hypothetical protein